MLQKSKNARFAQNKLQVRDNVAYLAAALMMKLKRFATMCLSLLWNILFIVGE